MNAHPFPRRSRGVSRFDVITGLGSLLLLVLVAGVPGSAESPQARLGEVGQRAREAFELARGLAVASGSPYGVALDAQGDRLAIIDQQGQLADLPDGLPALLDLGGLGVDVESAAFGQGGATAIFDGRGVPLAGGRIALSAGEGDGQQRLSLEFDAATGWLEARQPAP